MKSLLVILLFFVAIHAQAQVRIGEREARATATQFLSHKGQCRHLVLLDEIKSTRSGQTNLFLFTSDSKGYVIVSALNEILAYSFTSSLSKEALPDPFAYWLDLYNNQTDYLLEHPDQARKPKKSQESVGPLLTSAWGQGCYYNEYCPADNAGPCQHVTAGCVAIAMAQIMYYHKYPEKGHGSTSYTKPPYGTLSAVFESTTYQWEDMVDILYENNAAVAQLVYHCGVSVQTQYAPVESRASVEFALEAFRHYFTFPTATLSKRDNYSDEDWLAKIRLDLDNLHPVLYIGQSLSGTHAFVCDGYDENGLFHFNFGWNGDADGFFTLNDPSGFSNLQSIIYNLFPIDEIHIHGDEHGIIHVSPDGIGDGSSWEQATDNLCWAFFKAYSEDCSIWVKEGHYYGNPDDDYAFLLTSSCSLYGGFKGDEAFDYDLSQRDFEAHPSILDGNHIQGVIKLYHSDTFVIDGFTIQNGNSSKGGGILLSIYTQVRNCKFLNNYSKSNGGAISMDFPKNSADVIIEDCQFFGNEAKSYGGAVLDYGNTLFQHCLFQDNLAHKDGGGAICINYGTQSRYINCTFSNNTAQNGGGIANAKKQGPRLWNCLINNNTAETGGGCYFTEETRIFNCTVVKNEGTTAYGGIYTDSPAIIKNCIIWGNTSPEEDTQIGPSETYKYCAVEDNPLETDQNINLASENDGPLPKLYVRFQDSEVTAGSSGHGGDWRLRPNSPCIDRGTIIPDQPETDLFGNPRLLHNQIDLGVYESDVVTHVTEAYLCDHDPYYHQDSLLSELGTYTFLYPNTPYDSLIVIQMQEPPPPVALSEAICSNETYDFFGTPIDSVGSYQTIADCITYYLDLTVTEGTEHTMKAEICEGETYIFLNATLTHGGHFSHNIGCDSYDLDLTVKSSPRLRCSRDTIVEYGHPIQLTAWGADTYLWSTGETTRCITIYPISDKTYTVTGFSSEGCSQTAEITVKVTYDAIDAILFPNPAKEKITIDKPLIDEVEVFNLFGERVDHIFAHKKKVELDVSHYDSGIYIVHVRCISNHSYQKLIIQH